MKVLMLNGSPHKKGCTYTALSEVAEVLQTEGVETEFLHLGTAPVRGCIACGRCSDLGRCVFEDDIANEWLDKIMEADGIVIGSPVYYAGPNGALCAVLDRVFYSCPGFAGKVGAAIVSCRRGGSTAALDRLYKYFTIGNIPVVPSQYWNMVHGMSADDVRQDLEGMQTMRQLGANMAFMLKAFQKQGQWPQLDESRVYTNFVR